MHSLTCGDFAALNRSITAPIPPRLERAGFLGGSDELAEDMYLSATIGVMVELEYKPTERSRKWRKASVQIYYQGVASEQYALNLKHHNQWHEVRWVEV